MQHAECLRLKLSVEEILLNWMDYFDGNLSFCIRLYSVFGRMNLSISLKGEAFNPVLASPAEDDTADAVSRLLETLGLSFGYIYKNGTNYVSCTRQLKPTNRFYLNLLICFAAGLILGLAGKFMSPVVTAFLSELLNHISSAIMGLIRMISMPVISLCTINGIANCGRIEAFGKMGRKTLLGYLFSMFLMLVASVFFGMLFFHGRISGSAGGIGNYSEILSVFFSIFPDNMVSPFLTGDNIKILFISVLFGCALVAFDSNNDNASRTVGFLSDIFLNVMGWISKLLPITFFIIVVQMIWDSDSIRSCITVWEPALLIVLIYSAAIGVEVIIAAKKSGIGIAQTLSVVMPVALKAMAACSGMFVYSDMQTALTKEFNLDENYVRFSLPMGFAFFQPCLIMMVCLGLYFSVLSGIGISFSWLISMMLLCYFTSIAAPPVNGGMVALLMILFGSLGVSSAYQNIAASLIMLLDYPNTLGRISMMMLEIVRLSERKEKE